MSEFDLIQVRKQFHAQPEVSGQEQQTARLVLQYLKSFKPDKLIENLGGTGILAIYEGAQAGEALLFRAELDALPIQEINDFEHRSQIDGVSHKCGHDGHLSILLGLAKRLHENPIQKGSVMLLFQPAEETGEGAAAVLADPQFLAIQPDYVFALHNLPGYPLGQVILREGSFSAAVKSLIIALAGKTAHAAEPEHGHNPALAIAAILQDLDQLSITQVDREDFCLITPVHLQMGEKAYGVSAGHGEIHLTLRAWTEENLSNLLGRIQEMVDKHCQAHQLSCQFTSLQHFRANENNPAALSQVTAAAQINRLDLQYRNHPLKWGEDFGLFTQKFKGAIFGLGAGEDCPALHNPDYDFPDQLLDIGVGLFDRIIRDKLKLIW